MPIKDMGRFARFTIPRTAVREEYREVRMPAQLRVYSAPLDTDEEDTQTPAVRVRLADLLPLLTVAKKNNYLWLQDFLDDQVTVTPDLYDVLRSFEACQRPSA
jgi:hypothetical protein